MDFEPCFKVHNLVSVYPKGMKLGQMTNLNVIFHVVVSVYRLITIWNSPQFPVEFRNGLLFIMLYKVVLTFKSVDETLVCDHSDESYWAVLPCGTVQYALQGGSNFQVRGWNSSVWPFKWQLLTC